MQVSDIYHHKMSYLQRGKFFPQLTNLVRINTPKAVQTESRKAFRKLPNIESAMATLTSLKGVGTTLASGWSCSLKQKSICFIPKFAFIHDYSFIELESLVQLAVIIM